ncbi:RCS-specific HTH-type transcriptional activator RclR [BD1-7 clade bacterium]|uniref:RCS-specific HTH-type transcriptional activator RclR n=1 Tax=BD1-7 clade bacterium TaxID=2029982 RepID=A0A5S9QRH3_9GAMM|nr:RCS-specific HTH-type transcriptional activator RclR [BD1-7 clade bacterium]CAA0121284.1 RCS-specific HTH-type transcriptional activator RclR [BD1-7 clade bacterium]CAA0122307.1 RCS-specific HTH-type transcriptional activator RclR [BD1-7 clade bacterium]
MDSLSALLTDIDFSADVFFSGSMCGLKPFEAEMAGLLHFLKAGSMTLVTDQGHEIHLNQASVIFIPSGSHHRIQVKEPEDAELVCANIAFQPRHKAALVDHLPKFIVVPVDQDPRVSEAARWIFEEAFDEVFGRKIVIDRLCDIFMVQILRHVIENGTVEMGLFAASSHPRLAPLMKQLQESPQMEWTVDSMAEATAMSRSKFAALFKDSVGQAPMEYVTDLRLAMAQGLLEKNRPVGLVANEVGYENASSLSRVFKKRFGVTPKQWLKKYTDNTKP